MATASTSVLDMSAEGITGNRTIISTSLRAKPYLRSLPLGWYTAVEEYHLDVEPGTRFLIRRDHSVFHRKAIVIDYLTERLDHPNCHGGWKHVTVVYLEKETSPYPYHYDLHDERVSSSMAGMVFLQSEEPSQRFAMK